MLPVARIAVRRVCAVSPSLVSFHHFLQKREKIASESVSFARVLETGNVLVACKRLGVAVDCRHVAGVACTGVYVGR